MAKYDWEKPVSPIGDPEAMREQFAWARDRIRAGDREAGGQRLVELLQAHYSEITHMRSSVELDRCLAEKAFPGPESDEYMDACKSSLDVLAKSLVEQRPKILDLLKPAMERIFHQPDTFPDWMLDQIGGGAVYVTH